MQQMETLDQAHMPPVDHFQQDLDTASVDQKKKSMMM
jgi:hypothetical protein